MAYDDRLVAWRTFLAAYRTNNTTLTVTMATVSTDSITAQNITDINAAIAARTAALLVATPAFVKPDNAP